MCGCIPIYPGHEHRLHIWRKKPLYCVSMFDVLVYVYEHFWRGDSCPELPQLGRKLSAAGFESDDIEQALDWLAGLSLAADAYQPIALEVPSPAEAQPSGAALLHLPHGNSLRVYTPQEQQHLGAEGLGFLHFLESAGKLSAQLRETMIDRAMAASNRPVTLDEFKIIALMVYWGFGVEPDALILDELCDDPERVPH
ncbi:MAG: hypothetical protein RL111_1912 [Pseudomonadota bacterium]|jgi:Smg protein